MKKSILDHLDSCARCLRGTRSISHLHGGEAALRTDMEREGEVATVPRVHLLDDFSKLIKAAGHKHSCLLQSLVLGYCSFRGLVGTGSSMAKLYLEEKGEQVIGPVHFPRGNKGSWATSALNSQNPAKHSS